MIKLSHNAEVILKVYFGFTSNQSLSFTRPHAITPEAKAALEELQNAGLITMGPRNRYPGCPLDCHNTEAGYKHAQTIPVSRLDGVQLKMVND